MILHVLCASYNESPTTVCAGTESDCFLKIGISAKRYREVWSAMNCLSARRGRVESGRGEWSSRPTKANSLIVELEQDIAAINRFLMYVPGTTIFSLDDDHLRLSSRVVSILTSLRQVINPTKALGPVNNAVCSALTSGFLAGHHSRPKEQLIDTWLRLVQLIQEGPNARFVVANGRCHLRSRPGLQLQGLY